jgi:hypothetical protein
MQKYIYLTDFADLSQSLKEQLIDTIIEKKFMRGNSDDIELFNESIEPIKTVEDAKKNSHVREAIEKFNVDIVINY